MKYKEFYKWCNNRCFDGCWGMNEAILCLGVIEKIKKERFWRREKVWQEVYAKEVEPVVEATNEIIDKVKKEGYSHCVVKVEEDE